MKKLLYLLTLISFTAFSQQVDYKLNSEKVLEQFKQHNFQAIREQMDSAGLIKFDTATLSNSWNDVIAKNGAFVKKVSDEVVAQETTTIVIQRCKFEKNEVNFRLYWTSDNKIKSFVFSAFDAKPKYVAPSYRNDSIAENKKVLLITGMYRLPGTLSIPKTAGKHPLVILVHGSGPNDRDETFGPLKPFKDITYGLNNNGIAVLRYDKRTRLLKARLKHDLPNYTIKEEVLEDVTAAIEIAKQDSSIDSTQIYICGHSFGGMLLPRIANENPSIKGLIFLTPNARKLEDSFLAQAEIISKDASNGSTKKGNVHGSAKNQYDQIKALTASAVSDTTLLFDSPASYWYDLSKYDPIKTVKTIDKPMLFMFGSRDYQVTKVDEEMWRSALKSNKMATFKVYPKLNHFFVAGEAKSTPSEYATPGNVDFGLIKDMAAWLKANK